MIQSVDFFSSMQGLRPGLDNSYLIPDAAGTATSTNTPPHPYYFIQHCKLQSTRPAGTSLDQQNQSKETDLGLAAGSVAFSHSIQPNAASGVCFPETYTERTLRSARVILFPFDSKCSQRSTMYSTPTCSGPWSPTFCLASTIHCHRKL